MDPVDPTIEMGFGPSQIFRPGSATARPGQAGGGCCAAEQWILLAEVFPFSFFFKENTPEE